MGLLTLYPIERRLSAEGQRPWWYAGSSMTASVPHARDDGKGNDWVVNQSLQKREKKKNDDSNKGKNKSTKQLSR